MPPPPPPPLRWPTVRHCPHSLTEHTPAELLLKRQPRTRMSLIKPSLAEIVEWKQAETHDKGNTRVWHFAPSDHVMIRLFRRKDKWDHGVVLQALGPVGYIVQVGQVINSEMCTLITSLGEHWTCNLHCQMMRRIYTMIKWKTLHHVNNLRNHLHCRLSNLYRHQAHTDSQSRIGNCKR